MSDTFFQADARLEPGDAPSLAEALSSLGYSTEVASPGLRIVLCGALIGMVAACGGGGSSTETASAPETAGGSAPAQLVGMYTTTLEKSDIEAAGAPPELANADRSWRLTIANTGGPDDGPVLAIDNETEGNLEAPSLRVDGDRLLLRGEPCAAGGEYKFYDNEYRWKLSENTLEIMPVSNHCTDRVALTILTSQPWTKTG